MTPLLAQLVLVALISADAPAAETPIFSELVEKGIKTSDGSMVKLPPPIMANGLDAAGQRAAMDKALGNNDRRYLAKELVAKSFYAPVVVKVHNVKPPEGEGPAVRAIDTWFVAHGDWNTLKSKDFLDNVMKSKDEGKSQVVSKAGALSTEEMAKRKLTVTKKEGIEEQYVYLTFSLFDRVEVSATRLAMAATGDESVLAAARVDPQFDNDPEYRNQWRALVRDEQGEINPGPPHLFEHAGGYSKITRLKDPANAVFIESHLIYEEPYAWFDGVNLVSQRARPMINEKVKTFRRKLAVASEEKGEKKAGVRP
jgi:hypothetical protein